MSYNIALLLTFWNRQRKVIVIIYQSYLKFLNRGKLRILLNRRQMISKESRIFSCTYREQMLVKAKAQKDLFLRRSKQRNGRQIKWIWNSTLMLNKSLHMYPKSKWSSKIRKLIIHLVKKTSFMHQRLYMTKKMISYLRTLKFYTTRQIAWH